MKSAVIVMVLFQLMLFNPSEELIITHGGKDIALVSKKDLTMEPIVGPFSNPSTVEELLERVNHHVKEDPINARIGDSGEIIPEKAGYKLDAETLRGKLYQSLYSTRSNHIEAPKLSVHPKVNSEVLSSLQAQKIGHYVTYFNSRNEERSHNIRLAAESIDSHVIFPGELFSFNEVVGKRTKEKGYKPAPVIVRGEVTEGIGGGICQVSSTIYNAVDNAGVEIEQRYSHSKRVPYVPEGRDATVSWYGPDFTFRNAYNQPLLIRAKVYGGQMSVSVFSSDTIHFESREIPGASKRLPIETEVESGKWIEAPQPFYKNAGGN